MKEKVFVSFFCELAPGRFSDEMVGKMATGAEIYAFLMKDAGQCHDNTGNIIPGDSAIWYLGCNEKCGCLVYENNVSSWGVNESSFKRVRLFIDMMHEDGLFTDEQYYNLIKKIKEGSHIGKMKNIKTYLIKNKRRARLRERIKTMVLKTGAQLEGKSAL